MLPWIVAAIVFLMGPLTLMALLRIARAPGGRAGAAILAALVVGILAGPLVGGRLFPEWHTTVFHGATEERQALRELDRRQYADITALETVDVTESYINSVRTQHIEERTAAADDLATAEAAHRNGPLKRFAILFICLWTLPMGWLLDGYRRVPRPGVRTFMQMAPLIANALLIAIIMIVAARPGIQLALLFGALLTLPALSPALRGPRLHTAFVGMVVFGTAAALLAFTTNPHALDGFGIPILAGLAGCGIGAVLRPPPRWLRVVVPAMTAPVIAIIIAGLTPAELVRDRLFWASALIALIFASDGRWAAYRFALSHQTTCPWTHAADMVNAATGIVALVIGWLLMLGGVLPEPMLGGLVIGALIVDTLRHVRHHLGGMMDHPEAGTGEQGDGSRG